MKYSNKAKQAFTDHISIWNLFLVTFELVWYMYCMLVWLDGDGYGRVDIFGNNAQLKQTLKNIFFK